MRYRQITTQKLIAPTSKRRIVVVLGMHRSGTSLLTNLLSFLGVDPGTDLMPADSDNEKGYWENNKIYQAQDALLNRIAQDWGGQGFAYPFAIDWERLPEFRPFHDQLISIVRAEIAGAKGIWGFKDPRTCRLLPLWKPIFAELKIEPLYVLAVRNPSDVADSLLKRNALDPLHSELLWLLHNLEAVRDAGEKLRIVVDYDRWFTAPREQAQAVARALDLVWPADDSELLGQLTQTIRPDLRHSKARRACCLPFVTKTYEALKQAAAMGQAPVEILSGGLRHAYECLTGALELSSGAGRIALAVGHAEVHARNPESALEAYARATRLQPRLASAHAHSGLALQLLNRSAEALDKANQALWLDHTDAVALRLLAKSQFQQGQFDAAEQTCRLILRQDAAQADALQMIQEICNEKEKVKRVADRLFGPGATKVVSAAPIVPAPIFVRKGRPSVPAAASAPQGKKGPPPGQPSQAVITSDPSLSASERMKSEWNARAASPLRPSAKPPAPQLAASARAEAGAANRGQAPTLPAAPAVSVIIPVFNKIDLTRECLLALRKNTPAELCEVIVWDNASTDGTQAFFQNQPESNTAVRYFRSEENLGFVGGNNAAAQHARGRFIVFLNNDTQPQPGWLEALLCLVENAPGVGAVGAKLIYPDGKLQEAGGIIFRDASGWNYGRKEDPADPRFNFPREVDYCSAACLLVRAGLFRQLGGFDSRFAPAYYEDTDLCFALRQAGHKVLYQPRCEIIHHEGATAGQDLNKGFKRHQVTNRKKFFDKWEKVLALQCPPDPLQVRRASHRAQGQRILVIDPMMPMYDRTSGSRRLFEMLKLLVAGGNAVTFIARHGHMGERYAVELAQMGVEVYAGDPERMKELGFVVPYRPLDLKKLLQDSQYDTIILSFWYVAEQYLARIRAWSPASRVLIDTVDVHFLRERRRAELYKDPKLFQQAANTYLREMGTYRLADGLITVTEDDRQTLLRELPLGRIFIVPNIHELAQDVPPVDHRAGLLFVGGFSHLPNEDAVLYFYHEIWPRILQRVPGARWSIVGNNPPASVQALAGPAIQVTGYLPSVDPCLRSHLVSVAPLRYGAGMKGKIGEALAYGLPVVTTSIGAEGMSLKNGEGGVLVADDPEAFAAHVARLYLERDLWTQLSAQGRQHIESHFTPKRIARRLEMLLDQTVSFTSIIILSHNERERTEKCLQSIARHTPAPRHEIIVVDNGSTDGTADFLRAEAAAGRIRAILNTDDAGAAKACNQGARAARGQYVVFLHSDTEVQSNWLGSLFSLAEADAAVAAVGSKLLFPDGTIQHAGIALADCWDHDPLHAFYLFAQERSDFPMANQRRIYQAVTGACMLVRKAHFDEAGGFDEAFWNGCEDVDLCLRFQQKGWLTVYEPASVVIHHASPGGPESGARVPQNVERFHHKWLDHASPDVRIDQEGKNRMVPNSVMRLYSPPPGKLVSIIILAHNQLRDTQHCLASIERHTSHAHELVLVDNGSTDGTGQYFRNYAAKHSHVRLILNRANLGFSAGNNQGLACARGEVILLLNNDTVVTPRWLERMLNHLNLYPDCGLVGPVSNSVSGPQLVSTANYSSLDQLPKFATQWCATHAGQSIEAARLVGFCLLFRRAVLEKIGGLDPQYGSGNFEDDDFCIRAGLAGFKVRIALDSFVHHTGGQTFKGAKIDYRASMERNWSLFKAKWAMPQEAPLEKGYRLPSRAPEGLSLRQPLPDLKDSHHSSLEDRCWMDKTLPGVAPKKSSRPAASLALPACALLGHLGEARERVRKKQWTAAWTAALSAISARPYHPEAYLLLAEIALAAGDADSARHCAHAARDMAPDWAPPKQFLKGHLRGQAKPAWLQRPPAAAAPRVSVCLIAKNEERFLAQCLRSVRELAAQIIVVDTGSTDRTVEIARGFGAEVPSFAWCDDFSAARNAALAHATGDWVLIIDADEELAPQQIETAKRQIQAAGVLGYRLPIIDHGHEDGGCSYVPRLFRNAPGIFFVGRIHEQAFSSIQVRCQQWGLKHELGEVVLRHHGYTEEVMASRNKVERNLRLLERAIEELPGEPNLLMSLGLELVRSGKLDAGLERYWEAFHLMSALPPAEVTPELRETLLTQLSTQLMAAKRFPEIVQLWQMPFAQKGGQTASQHFCLGMALMELKQPAEAAEQMRQCAAKRDQPVLSPINREIRKAGPHHCLAMCLIALNDAEGAQRAFDDALAADPSSRPMRFDLARFHAAQGRMSEALKIARQLAEENPAESRVWELGGQIVLSRPEHLAFARDWTAEAVKHFPQDQNLLGQRAEALLLNQDVAEALPLWRRGPAPGSLRQRAAIVICELLTGDRQHHFTAAEEPALSQEVVKWYRQCIRMGAHALINQLHERMETIRLTLPAFVRVLEAAHRQARQAAA